MTTKISKNTTIASQRYSQMEQREQGKELGNKGRQGSVQGRRDDARVTKEKGEGEKHGDAGAASEPERQGRGRRATREGGYGGVPT